jgi:hypothetical protein
VRIPSFLQLYIIGKKRRDVTPPKWGFAGSAQSRPRRGKEKSLETFVSRLFYLVEISGIEPLTS